MRRNCRALWLRDLIAEPEYEYPQFVTALSLIGALRPDDAVALLRPCDLRRDPSGRAPPFGPAGRKRAAPLGLGVGELYDASLERR
jgi:hypothetical protein